MYKIEFSFLSFFSVCVLIFTDVFDVTPQSIRIKREDPLMTWNDSFLYYPDFPDLLMRYHTSFNGYGYAPGTAVLQEKIRQSQFPPGPCSSVSFLISHGNGADGSMGLGALIHLGALHLSLAISLGRVFLWYPGILNQYSDSETCGDLQGLSCFLRDPSNCTLEDALSVGADTVHVEKVYAGRDFGFTVDFIPTEVLDILRNYGDTPGTQPLTPAGSAWGESITKYMWRAQCSAFLMLLNERTITDLQIWRRLSVNDIMVDSASSSLLLILHRLPVPKLLNVSQRPEISLPRLPFRRGMISLHIRHGDKSTEMALVPSIKYLEAASTLQYDMSLSLIQQLFISTEDPDTIKELSTAIMGQPYNRWTIYFNNIPRSNSNGDLQLDTFSNVPRARITQLWLLQLFMALECDAWVGTRKSNWNRLIDELRCIWVPKCGHPFIEVGSQDLGW